MEFGLLGPLLVRCGGMVMPVQRGNQRALLATLLLAANRVVSAEEIAETLWGTEPPPSAAVTIRNYVKRLRHALGETGRDRISTRPPGYLISVGVGELDMSRFEAVAESARAAAREGCWDTAADQARTALALWRGEPLADVESDVLALREVPRLTEMRLQVLELRVDADLHLGRHAEVTAELHGLVRAYPLREHMHALLMLALSRCGRQSEALAAYQRARQVLVEELGTEPGADLQALHQRILTADPTLSTHKIAPPASAGGDGWTAPRQLPGVAAHFTGREGELAELTRVLDQAGQQAPGTVVISAIAGMAGVGKTALAVHWAHQVAHRFADGQLYVNLRGFDPSVSPVAPEEAIRELLDGLAVPAEHIPPGLAAQAGLYRSLLAGRRLLIVLDNARDEQQVRPLLAGHPGCLVLVTSRRELTGLAATDGARLLTLDALPPAEACQMLTARLGTDRAAPATVTQVAALCAHLPLALAIASARAAACPRVPLAALAAELRDAGRLDVLDTGDPAASIRAVFSWSIHHLTQAAARMFHMLALHPGPDVTAIAVASLAGVSPVVARRDLDELTCAHLITEHKPGRYALHDLLREYAADRVQAISEEQARRAVIRRVLDHYLHAAHSADRLLNPARDQITLAARVDDVQQERLADHGQAIAWFRAEHKVLLAVLALALHAGSDTHAWQLPWTMVDFLEFSGHWNDWIATQRIAVSATRRLADRAGEARCCRALGYAYARTGRDDAAVVYLRRALVLFREVGDAIGEARTHQDLSWLLDRQGQPASALHHDQIALRLYQQAGHSAGQANALNAIGWLHGLLGDYGKTVNHCRRALALHRELGNRRGAAATLDSLGYAYHHLGRHGQAVTCYERSLDLFRELADRSNEAEILTHLGDAHHAAGQSRQARDAWHQALAILDDLHHPDAAQVRARLTPADDARHGEPARP
ncbi:MAG: tetratricopeptide repeat protein [Streptosporangiaceae bacterium]|nr:tetratricopeptide repeat protein [Streptosporangiaceae bacterium]